MYRFGFLSAVTIDSKRQFVSALFYELVPLLGMLFIHAPVYHPSTYNVVERVHRGG